MPLIPKVSFPAVKVKVGKSTGTRIVGCQGTILPVPVFGEMIRTIHPGQPKLGVLYCSQKNARRRSGLHKASKLKKVERTVNIKSKKS